MSQREREHLIKGPGGVLPLLARDEAAVDFAMLIEGETSGTDLDVVLRKFGRSRSTYYEKLRRYRESGFEGLVARPPGPRSAWRRPDEVVRFIVTARLRCPARSAAEIVAELAREGHPVSLRSVERTLSQFGLTRGPRAAASQAEPPGVETALAAEPAGPPPAYPGGSWAVGGCEPGEPLQHPASP